MEGRGRWIPVSSRPIWSTKEVAGQPGLHREALSQTNERKIPSQYYINSLSTSKNSSGSLECFLCHLTEKGGKTFRRKCCFLALVASPTPKVLGCRTAIGTQGPQDVLCQHAKRAISHKQL